MSVISTGNNLNIGILSTRSIFVGGNDNVSPKRSMCKYIIYDIINYYLNKHDLCGITSLQPGPETDFAEICESFKIPYKVFVAHDDQNDILLNRDNYHNLLKKSSKIIKLGGGKYSPKKQMARKHEILKNSDVIIYVVSPLLRTSEIIREAIKNNVILHVIYP